MAWWMFMKSAVSVNVPAVNQWEGEIDQSCAPVCCFKEEDTIVESWCLVRWAMAAQTMQIRHFLVPIAILVNANQNDGSPKLTLPGATLCLNLSLGDS